MQLFHNFILESFNTELQGLLQNYFDNSTDLDQLMIIADWLDDHDDEELADLMRKIIEIAKGEEHNVHEIENLRNQLFVNENLVDNKDRNLHVNWSGIFDENGYKINIFNVKNPKEIINHILIMLCNATRLSSFPYPERLSTTFNSMNKKDYKVRQFYEMFYSLCNTWVWTIYALENGHLNEKEINRYLNSLMREMNIFIENYNYFKINTKFKELEEAKTVLLRTIEYNIIPGWVTNRRPDFSEFVTSFIRKLERN